jgi:Domain of unknown function (DUF6089)
VKKFILVVFLVLACEKSNAQYLWDFGIGAGVSNYLGDIGGYDKNRRNFVADLKIQKTRFDFSLFARYRIMSDISLKVEGAFIRLQGDDKSSIITGRANRNLNFRNDLKSLELTAEYFFYENNDIGSSYRSRNALRCYLFAGVGGIYHNPKGNLNGTWIDLRPLKTEGQSTPYKNINLVIPFGVGAYYTINKRHRIGWEFNWRWTFTDYLDDISTRYPSQEFADKNAGNANFKKWNDLWKETIPDYENDPLAKSFGDGNKRGDSKHKDQYITSMFTYSYVLRGKSSFYKSKYKSFFGGKNARRRKVRAKF